MWHDLRAICTGFEVVPLRTHANASKSFKQLLKTLTKWSTHKRTDKQFIVFARVLRMGGMTWMLFVRVLRLYPLKPMQIQASLPNSCLKPIQNAPTSIHRSCHRNPHKNPHQTSHRSNHRITHRQTSKESLYLHGF